MELLVLGIIIILIITVICILTYRAERLVELHGFRYSVGEDEGGDDVAKILHKMNMTSIELIKLMRKRIEQHNAGTRIMRREDLDILRMLYANLRDRYNPDVIQETLYNPLQPELTAYTLSKGKTLSMCVRQNGVTEPWPVLLLVLLHELTHIASNVRQHPPKFWRNYKFILRLIVEEGWGKNLVLPSGDVLYCNKVPISNAELQHLKHLYPGGSATGDIYT